MATDFILSAGCVPATVHIQNNADGVIRTFRHEWWAEDPDVADYIWSEGNYACNCNRSLFFKRAGGETDPESDPCGHDGYKIQIVLDDGTIVYDEF